MNTALHVIAGLGLFIIGIRLIGTHLRLIASRRMRQLIGRAVGGKGTATSLGLLLGAVMQSTNAVILMLANLVQAGLLDARRAQPVIAAANLGTAAVVMVASFSLRGAALVLLALIGLAFHLGIHESGRWRALVWAALGVGLLFLGVDFIRVASAEVKASQELAEVAAHRTWPLALHFGLGFAVTLVVQSSSVITIVAMTVAKAGLIDLHQGAGAVLGACLASGFTALMVGSRLKGRSRQLPLYQLALKAGGVAAAGALLLLEGLTGLPLLLAAAKALGLGSAQTLAVMYIVVHVLSDVVVHPFHSRLQRWIEAREPESDEERLARAYHLNDDSLAEPETALLLLEREQLALLRGLTDYVDELRAEAPSRQIPLEARHEGSRRLLGECQDFLGTLSDRHRSRELLDDFIVQRSRLELVGSLLETLWKFHGEAARLQRLEGFEGLVHAMLESAHLLLDQLAEVAGGRGHDGIEALILLTQDRSEMMDAVRRRGMGLSGQVTLQTQQSLFDATMYFERLVWLIGRYTRLLNPAATDREDAADND